jgi:hypothetical protein
MIVRRKSREAANDAQETIMKRDRRQRAPRGNARIEATTGEDGRQR